MAFVDQIALSVDQNFKNRCKVAMVVAAQNVSSEVNTTANHANRAVLSKAILNNPETYLAAFALGIAAHVAITAVSTDADVSFTASAIFNGIAGVA